MATKTPTKVNLLKTIYAGRAQFETLLNRLTEAQMTTPGVHGEWSVKDILAHLTAWERVTLERLNAGLSGRPLKLKPIKTDEDVEWMNEKVYAINQERPLGDIMDDFHTSFKRLMARVEEIGKKVLEKPVVMEWAGDRPVWLLIADNTYLHYEEHQDAIEKWLARGMTPDPKKDEGEGMKDLPMSTSEEGEK